MNDSSKTWGRVGIQGEKKKKTVQLVHHLKKRRLKGGDGDLGRESGEEENIYVKKQEQSLRGGPGSEAAKHDDEKGIQLQSMLGGYGSSSSGESDEDNDDGGDGDDKNAIKLPSARDLI